MKAAFLNMSDSNNSLDATKRTNDRPEADALREVIQALRAHPAVAWASLPGQWSTWLQHWGRCDLLVTGCRAGLEFPAVSSKVSTMHHENELRFHHCPSIVEFFMAQVRPVADAGAGFNAPASAVLQRVALLDCAAVFGFQLRAEASASLRCSGDKIRSSKSRASMAGLCPLVLAKSDQK